MAAVLLCCLLLLFRPPTEVLVRGTNKTTICVVDHRQLKQVGKIRQIRWRQTLQTFVDEHSDLVCNALANRKPVQITQYRCNVIEFPRTGDQSFGSVLNQLQLPQHVVADTGQQTVAVVVVETAADEYVHQVLDGIEVSDPLICRNCRS